MRRTFENNQLTDNVYYYYPKFSISFSGSAAPVPSSYRNNSFSYLVVWPDQNMRGTFFQSQNLILQINLVERSAYKILNKRWLNYEISSVLRLSIDICRIPYSALTNGSVSMGINFARNMALHVFSSFDLFSNLQNKEVSERITIKPRQWFIGFH